MISEAAPRANEHTGSASLRQCLIAGPPGGRESRRAGRRLESRVKILALQDSSTARVAGLAGVAAVFLLSSAALIGQAPAGYKTPRTPWGDPDLQGIWPSTDMVGVPIERPVEFGTRATLSDTEFKQRQAQAARQAESDDEAVVVPRSGGGGDGTGPPSRGGGPFRFSLKTGRFSATGEAARARRRPW